MSAVLTRPHLLAVLGVALLATACEPATPVATTLRTQLTASEATRWSALDPDARRSVRLAARADDFSAWEVQLEPTTAIGDVLELLAAFDDARLRDGRDIVPAAVFTHDPDSGVVRSETCRRALTSGWATRSEGVALRWSDGVPRGTVEARVRGWLLGCGVDRGTLDVEIVARAPFLAAAWPERGVVFVHPVLAGLLDDADATGNDAPRLGGASLALNYDSFPACLDALTARCAPCTGDPDRVDCNDDLLTPDGFEPAGVFGLMSCNRLAELRADHPWIDDGVCAGHALTEPAVAECLACGDDGELQMHCLAEPLPLGQAQEGLENLSVYRNMATFTCRHALEACMGAEPGACTPVTPPDPPDPMPSVPDFEVCATGLQSRCASCLAPGDSEDDPPADCSAIFPVSTLAQDCVDIGYPTFGNAARLAMYCAWQSDTRPACVNAQQLCVREEIEVVSFDTLTLAYAPFAEARSREACIEQVVACGNGEGVTLPDDVDPQWRIDNQTEQNEKREGCDCGDDC